MHGTTRTTGSTRALEGPIRRVVAEVDPLVPVRVVSPMEDVVRAAYATAWVMMGLLLLLAVLATTLGAVRVGDRVHVEGDMIGKFVRQLMADRERE